MYLEIYMRHILLFQKLDWEVFLQNYLPVDVTDDSEFQIDLKNYFPNIGAKFDKTDAA